MSENAAPPVFNDPLGELSPEVLGLFGGKEYPIGHQDGVLVDHSRGRRIRYRLRYPKGLSGEAPIILFSPGGMGGEYGHLAWPHFGTAYARLGFLAFNIGHLLFPDEAQHRYHRPLDISFMIDMLARLASKEQQTPYKEDLLISLPEDFGGVLDVDHVGVIGHSFGAYTANAVAGADWGPVLGTGNFRGPRVDAIVALAQSGKNRHGGFDKGPDNNSWMNVKIPSYVLIGDRDYPAWRRQPFDRYPKSGDKFLTIGKDQDHAGIAGYHPGGTRRFVVLNTSLFFHTYLRSGQGQDFIGKLDLPDGWTLERKLESKAGY